MIHLQNIELRRDDKQILSDVNLKTNRGEQWVILGRNGSGKTTILELMTGYLFPSSGRIEVLGHRYGSCDVREVRKEIGYIGQSMIEKLNLGDPVREVVATGEYAYLRFYQRIPEEVARKARDMLDKLEISHLSERPLGVLSQGERKKVLLARAMMAEPKLLIMDEPCSGLDLYEREKLLKAIGTFSDRDIQMIYVTHHIEEIIPPFTHVALIDGGRVAAAGPKRKVLTAERLRQVYEVDARIDWFADRPWVRVGE